MKRQNEMRIGSVAGALLVLVLLACSAIADESPKVTLDAQSTPIKQVVTDLSKQSGIQIMCDSDVRNSVTGRFESMDLEKLLDTITKSNNLKWQKIYLSVQNDQSPTLEQVKSRAEAISALTGGSIVVYDPATGKQKVFVEQVPATPSVEPDKLGLKPIYLISKPKDETKEQKSDKDTAARFTSLQNERLKLLAGMSPEQRVSALQQEMLYMTQVDPGTRQQMMLDQMNARRNMNPQMREAYQQTMRETFQSMREQGLIPAGEHRQGGNRRGDGGQPQQ